MADVVLPADIRRGGIEKHGSGTSGSLFTYQMTRRKQIWHETCQKLSADTSRIAQPSFRGTSTSCSESAADRRCDPRRLFAFSTSGGRVPSDAQFKRMVKESLLILGWLANWRPLEIFFYDWWPIARRRDLYLRLSAASLEKRVIPPATLQRVNSP
jgi:hypothetical protein